MPRPHPKAFLATPWVYHQWLWQFIYECGPEMSSGKVHAVSTGVLAIVSAPIIAWSAVNIGLETFLVLPGILLGVLITPDFDIDNRVVSHGYMDHAFGKLLGYGWYYFWHSYSISFKHRSALSHAPVISTLIRLTFMVFPPIILLFRNQQTGLLELVFYLIISTLLAVPLWGMLYLLIFVLQINIIFFAFLALGLVCADLLHFILDNI